MTTLMAHTCRYWQVAWVQLLDWYLRQIGLPWWESAQLEGSGALPLALPSLGRLLGSGVVLSRGRLGLAGGVGFMAGRSWRCMPMSLRVAVSS